MLELLFIVAMVSWAVISLLQFLAGLPAAPTLLAAAVVVPLLAFWRARCLARIGWLKPPRRHGGPRPLPPERFYWPATRRWLGRRTVGAALLAAVAWPVAILWPAPFSWQAGAIVAWIVATTAIAALAEAAAGLWLYVKTSQRFNRQTPGLIGWLRRGLYRFSDNHEFLGEEPLPREKRARESVY
ncbi:MAG: hypothetical protein WEC73_03530 [Chthoniobacterales bacterium]